jgi:hypothetical protein
MTWPVTPEPTYRVEHQDWCYSEAHARCCNLNKVDIEDCTCGAAEAQAEIDSLADTVRVQRQALDRIEQYVTDCANTIGGQQVKAMAAFVRDIIRTAR